MTTSTLFLGGEKIGVVTFDLATQIGKERLPVRAMIGDSDPANGKALIGDASKYPKAYLEVHYKVTASAKTARTESVSDVASIAPSTTRSRGSNESRAFTEETKDSHVSSAAVAATATVAVAAAASQ